MKIGVISDTHLAKPDPFLKRTCEEYFSDVEFILHAGDISLPPVLEAFNGKKIIAVSGNNDSPEIRKQFPVKKIIKTGDFQIGIIHGSGPPIGLRKKVAKAFNDIDCIVYGHSHWAINRRVNGTLFFNPGSFSKSISSLWRRSIGILTVNSGISGEIIRF